ncbi:MAG: hypothetical protein R3C02_07745 [Planctomycetaceae bacterium]
MEPTRLFEDVADTCPFLSRCIEIPLSRRGLSDAFAQRAVDDAGRKDSMVSRSATHLRLKDCATISARARPDRAGGDAG